MAPLNRLFSFAFDDHFLLLVRPALMAMEFFFLVYLYGRELHSQKARYLRQMLVLMLLCFMAVDIRCFVGFFIRNSLLVVSELQGYNIVRFAWLLNFTLCQAIALFLMYFTENKVRPSVKSYLHLILSFFISGAYVVGLILRLYSLPMGLPMRCLRTTGYLYNNFVIIIISIIYAIRRAQCTSFPRILRLQVYWALYAIFLPGFVLDIFLGLARYVITISPELFRFIATSTHVIWTIGMLLVGRIIFRLRFLNSHKKVISTPRPTFAIEMKNSTEALNTITSPKELPHVITSFFNEGYAIPQRKTHFYLNDKTSIILQQSNQSDRHTIIQSFFSKEPHLVKQLKKHEILVMDELAFSNFYEHDLDQEKYIALLEKINADLLLPIFKGDSVVACIVIDRHARNKLYSNVETDEMLVFARYIGNLINILQNKDLEVVINRELVVHQQLLSNKQNLEEELNHKRQENNQYRESLRSFLRNSQQREIGIVFYKNRRFSFANQAAQTLIKINLNKYPGHPVTRSITRIARDVEAYNTTQSCIVKDSNGKRIVFSAVPNLEKNSVIITAHPPEVSDLVKKQIDRLKEPRNWDYLLYLETTKSGRLINELIPGSSESILNFKIELLKTALSGRASLICVPSDDVVPMANILHQISLRETLHVIKLHDESPTTSHTAIELFGANKLIYSKDFGPPLLKKLDKVGTLLIENVQYLTLNAQKQLTEYLLYGYFNPVHSEEKIVSDVRIICSSNQDLKSMVHEGLFDARLYKALQKTSVKMPSLISLDSDEFKELTTHIASQSIKNNEPESLVGLSKRERNSITNKRPASLTQLQHKIKTLLTYRSKNTPISYDSSLNQKEVTDPVISQALQLGKKALRNEKLMRALWNKFKNQNKIAILLGVNRSSVNRRCSEYNLA